MSEIDPILVPPPAVRIGDEAPDFTARTTEGVVTLSDFRGRWLVFFTHPGDFTPVCTSEFVAIANAWPQFQALDCALLGHSVDSLFSHISWVRTIRDELGVTIPFPIVEDPTLAIAREYGMVSAEPDTASTVRAVYFIDPLGCVRAISWYPLEVGRSVEEMLRVVAALQRTADGSVLAPAGWKPGNRVLAQPQLQASSALEAQSATSWFYHEIEEEGGR